MAVQARVATSRADVVGSLLRPAYLREAHRAAREGKAGAADVRAAEVYYNVSLAECCQIVANVQWVFSGPNQVTGGRNRDAVVPGLRALILF